MAVVCFLTCAICEHAGDRTHKVLNRLNAYLADQDIRVVEAACSCLREVFGYV